VPRVDRDGVELVYRTDGAGETVAFVPDLGYGAWQWAWQAPAVAGPFETVVYDARGSGRSDPAPGSCDLGTLVADLDAVLSAVGARRAHLVGAGLGGMVAAEYARTHGRVASLALLGTSAGAPDVPENPVERLAAPRDDRDALRATLDPVLSAAFRAEQPEVLDGIAAWRAGETLEDVDAEEPPGGDASLDGWRAQAAALSATVDPLYEIDQPALVVHGTDDAVWPPDGGAALAADLPRGRHEPVAGASHLVGVERSRTVNDLLTGFLDEHADDGLD
jgi:3-oxoadipate enol-lactonase